MRSIRFSFRNLALACVATAAIAAGACSDSTSTANAGDITQMRLRIGNQRDDYFFSKAGNGTTNVAVLSGIGLPLTLTDTIVTVAWLRKDSTIDDALKPALGWKAYVDTLDARNKAPKDANGQPTFYISPRARFDAYGFNMRANTAIPAPGINVDFFLLNPSGEKVFGPITVTIKTP